MPGRYLLSVTFEVVAEDGEDAVNLGHALADHVHDTFNDDATIGRLVEVASDPAPRAPEDHALSEGDYTLTDGGAWFTVGGISVRIFTTADGEVDVAAYEVGREAECPLNAFRVAPADLVGD